MDFEKRLERAIVRGEQNRDQQERRQSDQAINEDELKALHSKCRLELSDHIENCLKKLADHFPGFSYQTIVGEAGWGANVSRDDFEGRPAQSRQNYYSRLEMMIRPYSSAHIVDLAAKATVRNKEIFNRHHYQFLSQADIDSFNELIDLWVLEYAEQYATRT